VGLLKAFSVFSLGPYSFAGVGVMIAIYLSLYGSERIAMRLQRKTMPRHHVIAFIVLAGFTGFALGCLVQGLSEIRAECAAYGEGPKPCLLKRLGRTSFSGLPTP
jgi:hypothetical protein